MCTAVRSPHGSHRTCRVRAAVLHAVRSSGLRHDLGQGRHLCAGAGAAIHRLAAFDQEACLSTDSISYFVWMAARLLKHSILGFQNSKQCEPSDLFQRQQSCRARHTGGRRCS